MPPPGMENSTALMVPGGIPSIPIITPSIIPQLTRQSRRLYVGGFAPDINELELTEFVNEAMMANPALLIQAGPPVVSVQLHMERNFAFVEFRSAEECSNAMSLDGIVMRNFPLKFRRPKDYVAGSDQNSSVYIPGIISTNVADTPNKIFIGGIPPFISDEQVKQILSPFGQLKSFNLVRDTATGVSKGFAFCEFWDPPGSNTTDRVCEGLSGLKLGDKNIVVQRAEIGAKSQQSQGIALAATGNFMAPTNILNMNIPLMSLNASVGSIEGNESPVLQLMNMISHSDLASSETYADIAADIQSECSKYGSIISMCIPRPRNDKGNNNVLGMAFVEYNLSQEADLASTTLAGRAYNHRTIMTSFVEKEAYEKYVQQEETPDTVPENEHSDQGNELEDGHQSGPLLLGN
eukprot:TRINITY_DN595_c0_g2_i1.p1 TRINITY_DN595_c0_g2~~TRINITY_DN595_c0_g2_i1.p1  ORF type:complete len:474 (-),score=82.58 TRINITY_DN595_c0_g2_i1:120-1340(-)